MYIGKSLLFRIAYACPIGSDPANTKCNMHVIIRSKNRFGIIITRLLRCVFAGEVTLMGVDNTTSTISTKAQQNTTKREPYAQFLRRTVV